MEWVETTAKSLEEAKDLALDKLGVDDTDAEFEVLEEPRQGLFGRTRGQARVRARIAPKTPRAKEDRNRNRKRRGRGEGGGGGGNRSGGGAKSANRSEGGRPDGERSEGGRSEGGRSGGNRSGGSRDGGNRNRGDGGRNRSGGGQREKKQSNRQETKVPDASIEEVNASVEKFLTGLTAAFGYDTPVEIDLSNDEVAAQIAGKHGLLLGPKARTLDAIQELTRITAQRQAPSGIRIKVDVGGYREQRSKALGEFAATAAQTAIDDGVEVVLEPMSAPDRKVVHDALNEVDGVSTRSAGQEPRRRVIIVPDEVPEDEPVADEADVEETQDEIVETDESTDGAEAEVDAEETSAD